MEDIIGILLYNTFTEPPGSILKIWEKERTVLTPPGTPSREKRTCYITHSQQGLEKVKGEIERKQHTSVKLHHIKKHFAILLPNSFI